MHGRISSIATMLSLGPVPLASLAAGLLLQTAGTTPTILALTGVMLVVALSAFISRSVSHAPDDLPAKSDVGPAGVERAPFAP
jgi:hypothetical protein